MFVVGGNIAVFFCLVAVMAAGGGISAEEILPVIVPVAFIAAIAHLTFVYRLWNSIRDGSSRMSPGKAVGLLFLPIFNIYWIFQVYGGFATDYNNYVKERGISAPALSQGLLVLHAMLMLIPVPLLNWSVQALAISKICNAVNSVRPSHS